MTVSANQTRLSIKDIRKKKTDILKIKRADSTKREYFRIYNRIRTHVSQKDGIDFQTYIDSQNQIRMSAEKKPLCKNTLYAYKAALQTYLAIGIKKALAKRDANQKILAKYKKIKNLTPKENQKIEVLKENQKDYRIEAEKLYVTLEILDADYETSLITERNEISKNCESKEERVAALAELKSSPYKNYSGYRKNSKRKSLKGLPDNWIDQYLHEIRPEFKLNLLVMALTGCRPEELQTKDEDVPDSTPGIQVKIKNDQILLKVFCAKYDQKNKGHKYRIVHFDSWANRFAQDLHTLIASTDDKKMIIGLPSGKTLKQFCNHTRYVGNKLFPGVSAYSLRHAFASNIKAEGNRQMKKDIDKEFLEKQDVHRSKNMDIYKSMDRQEAENKFREEMKDTYQKVVRDVYYRHKTKISRALGQASTRTQQHYGTFSQGGKFASGMLECSASGPVKVVETSIVEIPKTDQDSQSSQSSSFSNKDPR